MRLFFVVRHGSCNLNIDGHPLDNLGEKQITMLAQSIQKLLKVGDKVKIFYSTLLRAKQSAQLLSHLLGDSDLCESRELTLDAFEKPEEQRLRAYELFLFAKEEGMADILIFLTHEEIVPWIIPDYFKNEYGWRLTPDSNVGCGRGVGVNLLEVPTKQKQALLVI